jgi:hypothetical protein
VSFAACIQALIFARDPNAGVNKTMLIVVTFMCLFATLDIAFGLRHVLDAFIWYRGPGGAEEDFEDISNWVNVMKSVIYGLQTLTGDLILVVY